MISYKNGNIFSLLYHTRCHTFWRYRSKININMFPMKQYDVLRQGYLFIWIFCLEFKKQISALWYFFVFLYIYIYISIVYTNSLWEEYCIISIHIYIWCINIYIERGIKTELLPLLDSVQRDASVSFRKNFN